jgi:hypothetical protein
MTALRGYIWNGVPTFQEIPSCRRTDPGVVLLPSMKPAPY